MDDEARTPSGLDPAHRREPRSRPPWGRRWPPRHPRPEGGANTGYARSAYAALDLGTNNCRLLVARPVREGFRVIDAFSRIIRLGEGMAASGRLGEPAIERAIEALSICRDKMHNRAVTRARLIATEACRSAANGAEFRERVRGEVSKRRVPERKCARGSDAERKRSGSPSQELLGWRWGDGRSHVIGLASPTASRG